MDLEWPGWVINSFCKCAADWGDVACVMFVTDPERAVQFWELNGFTKIAAWARDGFPGIYANPAELSFWILSPDG